LVVPKSLFIKSGLPSVNKVMLLDFEMKEWAPTELARKMGKSYGGFFGGEFYSMLLTYAGAYRGNHIHPNRQSTILLSPARQGMCKR
jgi:hypothetical protein